MIELSIGFVLDLLIGDPNNPFIQLEELDMWLKNLKQCLEESLESI